MCGESLILTPAVMSSSVTLVYGLIMIFLARREGAKKGVRDKLEQLSSDVYYLGFILTLFGLAVALKRGRLCLDLCLRGGVIIHGSLEKVENMCPPTSLIRFGVVRL